MTSAGLLTARTLVPRDRDPVEVQAIALAAAGGGLLVSAAVDGDDDVAMAALRFLAMIALAGLPSVALLWMQQQRQSERLMARLSEGGDRETLAGAD